MGQVKRFSLSSLRARLVGLVLVAMLPLLALLLFSATKQRANAAAQTERHALEIVQLAAAGQTRLFEGARQLLSALGQIPEARSTSPGAADTVLRNIVHQYPFYINLSIARSDGRVLSSALPREESVEVSEYACVQEAVQFRQFATGGFRVGKISGQPLIGVAYPVFGPTNDVQNVLVASLDLRYLGRELIHASLPDGAQLTVIDAGSRVLASAPAGLEIGQPAALLPAENRLIEGRSAHTLRAFGKDGVERFYAFAPVMVGRGPVDAWVNIAIPVASVYFAADYELRLHLLTLAMVVALALTAAWFGSEVVVLRNVRALVQAAQKIKDGELGVRTGIRPGADELGQLSGLFDEMAVALQQRDTERLRAADALRRSRDQLEGLVQERAQELGNERDLLRSLVDNLPDYVYVKGVDGRYIVDNATHRSLLGVGTSEEVVGRTAFDFFPAELAERYQADDRAVFETGLPLFNREEQVADRSGRRLLIATTKVPLRDKAGKVIGLVGVGRDITARRQEA